MFDEDAIKKSHDDFAKSLSAMKQKIDQNYSELVELLKKHGSVELMSQLIAIGNYLQNPIDHDPNDPLSEYAFVLFLSGLFLQHNNLNAKVIHPNLRCLFIDKLQEYYQNFQIYNMVNSTIETEKTSYLKFLGIQGKLLEDANPRSFPFQKEDHIKSVFGKIDDFFQTNYGFSIENALEFINCLLKHVDELWCQQQKYAKEKFDQAIFDYKKDENKELRQKFTDQGITVEDIESRFADFCSLTGSEKVYYIKLDDFRKKYNILKLTEFSNFMNTLSCTFGEQFDDFENPLSENILRYKPFIRIEENGFLCPLLTDLNPKLDNIFEYLLKDEKQNDTKTWKKYEQSKSDYLENKTYEYFARVFPDKCMYRNLHYKIGSGDFETDLLIVFDNKILIIEAKSNHLSVAAKRGGIRSLEKGLKKIIKKAYDQANRVKSYIQSADSVDFKDGSGNSVLTLNNKNQNYQFYFINSTLEILDTLAANPKELDALDMFKNQNYPWSVNLYDLDIITDCISSPIRLLHYVHQRLDNHKRNIIHTVTEGEFLGYYFEFGNFYDKLDESDKPFNIIVLVPGYFNRFEEYYVFEKDKPQLKVFPLSELIDSIEKYEQPGFTDIAISLLDFPPYHQKLIKKKMDDKLRKIKKDNLPDGFSIAIPVLDIGFSYFTSITTTNLHKRSKQRATLHKYITQLSKWVMIGRNVKDTKNPMTVYYYMNEPWIHDPIKEANSDLINQNYFRPNQPQI